MILHVADGVLSAGRFLDARIHAATAVARQIVRTVVIGVALDPIAMDLGIAVVARTAAAGRLMVLAVAFRVDGALVVENAGIHALAVVTSGGVIALAVRFAVN